MRATRFTLAALACALLAGCGTDDIVTPETEARFTDTDCVDCAPPPPPPAYSYGSKTKWDGIHKGWSWTIINDDWLASGRVDATAYTYRECGSRERQVYQTASRTVYGVGKAEVYFAYNGGRAFQVGGTHTITPRPGYYGGGTFYSSAGHCF